MFEDLPNGILAARQAGIFTIVVPNPITPACRWMGQTCAWNRWRICRWRGC
jgi:beta-phosphoglucomutase-like phosphatase (HAD superfamily)